MKRSRSPIAVPGNGSSWGSPGSADCSIPVLPQIAPGFRQCAAGALEKRAQLDVARFGSRLYQKRSAYTGKMRVVLHVLFEHAPALSRNDGFGLFSDQVLSGKIDQKTEIALFW